MQCSTKYGRKGTILISEEEPEVRNYLIMALEAHGYNVESADSGNEIVEFLHNSGQPASAILLAMPHVDGLATVRKIRRENEDLPLILLASLSSPVTPAQVADARAVMEKFNDTNTTFLAKVAAVRTLDLAGHRPTRPVERQTGKGKR